ncbi:membrane transporter [Ophiocordyceps camponoti-floridani]|uniref:Membrane transporter n=1 Tax=Ophiocordyceps camponoti-floridani TaxID=2030778 RepID=A0A8H4VET1_9HYPO|nr:membrane transporter [Ophiocordyceps camponoti-floridani]
MVGVAFDEAAIRGPERDAITTALHRPPTGYPPQKLEAGESIQSLSSGSAEDVLALQDVDPVLNMKMHLVNDAIDEIGWTPYHLKLFFLSGFGYAVDSMILNFQSNITTMAYLEMGNGGYRNALTIAVYGGMLSGALFWGLFADMIGRKLAFNLSLFMSAICCILAGVMPSWSSLGLFIGLLGFGSGGNLILDSVVFLEYLPSSKQSILTMLACWWGIGQTLSTCIAWIYMTDSQSQWNCNRETHCNWGNNAGWRYALFTGGGLVLTLSLLRVTVVRLRETPKYQLSNGKDAELVETFHVLATKYGRSCSLTIDKLEACGAIQSTDRRDRFFLTEALAHVGGLFSTRTLAQSTIMIWLSWAVIGLAYALFYAFLPTYFAASGLDFGRSVSDTYRNLIITELSGVPGPILAGFLCNWRVLGRRYTMFIGALCTAPFFVAYPLAHTSAQNLIMTSFIAFFINVYYSTLYAYTPEVLPSPHRATGNGIAVACNRVMGIVAAVVVATTNTATGTPFYICGGLLMMSAAFVALFPLEPCGRRSS